MKIIKPGVPQPQLAWFLSANVYYVCACVCVHPEGYEQLVAWCGVTQFPYDWSNKFCGFYMAAVVDIISGRDVSIHTRRGN